MEKFINSVKNKTKLNVAFVCREFPCYSETFIFQKAQNLLEQGHDVHIYCKIYNKNALRNEEWIGRVHVFPCNYNIVRIIYYSFFNFFRITSFPQWIRFFKEFKNNGSFLLKVMALSRLGMIHSVKWDIIHAHFLVNVDCFAVFPSLSTIPLVCSVLGYDATIDPYQGESSLDKFKRRIDRCDGLIYSSSFLYESVHSEMTPVATEAIIYPEFDSRLFLPKIRKKTHLPCRLVTVGRLHWAKGYSYALTAVWYLLKMGIDIEYRIAGEGESREEIEYLIRQMGLTRNVVLLGALEQNKIASLMGWADIYLCMSNKEEFGVVLCEAEASGLPIVAAKVGGVPESTAENQTSLLVPPRDWMAAAKAIMKLIDEPDLYEQMSKSGPECAKRCDHNVITPQIVSFYGKILKKKYFLGNNVIINLVIK